MPEIEFCTACVPFCRRRAIGAPRWPTAKRSPTSRSCPCHAENRSTGLANLDRLFLGGGEQLRGGVLRGLRGARHLRGGGVDPADESSQLVDGEVTESAIAPVIFRSPSLSR